MIGELGLTAEEYRQWVDWINPLTGESMGRPRLRGEGGRGSPRFVEMVVNVPKSLSVTAGLHPAVSEALDAAQRDAVAEIRSWLGQHSVTRVGSRGKQEVVPIEQLETVAVSHKTSRAGDPHRHIHFQIGTRVWAAGRWRGLYTAALFRQQGAIRALGTAVIAAHPQLAAMLDAHGLTLDPVTGEVAELVPWNAVMSKRGQQVARNLARFEAEWEAAHPGQEPGPVVRARLHAKAWDHERPSKKPSVLGSEAGWLRELQEAGYTPDLPRAAVQPLRTLDELAVQRVASRALDRCAAAASAWTVHDVQERVARIVTEAGVRATREELREFIAITTRLASDDCLSILPPGAPRLEHVAHLTTLHVVAVETELRDRLAARATRQAHGATPRVQEPGLDVDQARAAAAVASTAPLVVVEGAAGAGKTTMLGAAIRTAEREGRSVRVVTPTKKAADVAAVELGVPTDSVAALVYDHGFRWNADGVWTRLAVGDTDPVTGATYRGPARESRLAAAERVVVDEAGMLDQDTALALLTVADEAGATLALVGDRAQLPAVGRGGMLDIAAALVPRVYSLTSLHRFADPDYARLTLDLRAGRDPAGLFDRLHALGLVRLHEDAEALRAAVAAERIERSRDHRGDQRRGARAEHPDPREPGARGRGRRRPHHRRRGRPQHRRRRPHPDPPQRLGGGRGEPADLDRPARQRRRQPVGARRCEPAEAAAHRASARRVRRRARAPGLRRDRLRRPGHDRPRVAHRPVGCARRSRGLRRPHPRAGGEPAACGRRGPRRRAGAVHGRARAGPR
ncbi:MobF family relaxase [Salana multivorans]